MKSIDYYMHPASPWTYLGHQRFAELRMAVAGDLLSALWKEDRNLADPALLDEIAQRHGVSGADRRAYERYTDEALGRGMFGAPSYVYNDEIFWGQDRLDFLDRALKK